jgi:hypothetical protein
MKSNVLGYLWRRGERRQAMTSLFSSLRGMIRSSYRHCHISLQPCPTAAERGSFVQWPAVLSLEIMNSTIIWKGMEAATKRKLTFATPKAEEKSHSWFLPTIPGDWVEVSTRGPISYKTPIRLLCASLDLGSPSTDRY